MKKSLFENKRSCVKSHFAVQIQFDGLQMFRLEHVDSDDNVRLVDGFDDWETHVSHVALFDSDVVAGRQRALNVGVETAARLDSHRVVAL